MITGASAGLGAEFARELASRAKGLILVARNKDKLEEMARELKGKNSKLEIMTEPCDFTKTDDIDRMVHSVLQKNPVVDVLINNAGIGDFEFFDKTEWENTERMIQVNCIALAYLTHRLVPPMVQRGKGGIINVGSVASMVTIPTAVVYNATKHFVDGFTETLALDLAGTGVVVTQVNPGPVATEGIGSKGAMALTSSKGPYIVKVSAKQCAQETIKAFESKKIQVVPGFILRWMLWLYSFVPTWVTRTFSYWTSLAVRNESFKRITDKSTQQPTEKTTGKTTEKTTSKKKS